MNVKGGTVVGGGVVLGDAVLAIATNAGTAKATPIDEIPAYGRGSAGVRLTKLGDGQRVTTVYVGALDGMQAVMSVDGNPSQVDPNPVAFPLAPTKRDLVSTTADHGRKVLAIGSARW